MELYEAMRTSFACREFIGEPIPSDVLRRIVDNARFAPSGGNRQGWRIISVEDRAKRLALADMAYSCAARYFLEQDAGEGPFNSIKPSAVTEEQVEAAKIPPSIVNYIHEAPTLLVVALDLSETASMDMNLNRVGLVSGASVYPLVWNVLLAARNEGFAGTLTTMAIIREPEMLQLLEIPLHWAVAAVIPLGKPKKQINKLKRRPVEELLVIDSWSGPTL